MIAYKNLSIAQKRVVDWLKEDKDSYCKKSQYYDFQSIHRPNIVENRYKVMYCARPTLMVLIEKNVLIEKEDRYVLNHNFITL